jgi:serine/threonine protein kinase
MTDSSPQRHAPKEKIDDEDGHYIVHENSRLGEKYNLLNLLGQGTFGKVVRAIDIRNRKEVAVKIIRAVPKVCNDLYAGLHFIADIPGSTVMLVASSSECSKHCARRTSTTAIGASNYGTASTGVAISALSHPFSDYPFSTS